MTDGVLAEIQRERERQDAKWGGPDHDDQHTMYEWFDILNERMATIYDGRNDQRRALVEMAAISVAVIECIDRREMKAQKDT